MASSTADNSYATGREMMRSWHPERTAWECGHVLHPYSPYTALCPKCVLWKATERHYGTSNTLLLEGGEEPPASMRDRPWCVARLSHQISSRRYEKAQRKYDARREREREWDQAHMHLEYAITSREWSPEVSPRCPVCSISDASDSGSYDYAVDMTTTWWERPHKLVSKPSFRAATLSKTPEPASRGEKATIPMPGVRRPPSVMRDFIRIGREEVRGFNSYGAPNEMLWRMDVAVRSKCTTIEIPYNGTDYLTPAPAGPLFKAYKDRRREEHEQRNGSYINKGALSRTKLSPSPLSQVESVDDFEVTAQSLQEVAGVERAERAYRKARSQVALLHLVGTKKTLMEELGGIVFWNDHESVRRRRIRLAPLPPPLVENSMDGAKLNTGLSGRFADVDQDRADSVPLDVGQHFGSELEGWGVGGGDCDGGDSAGDSIGRAGLSVDELFDQFIAYETGDEEGETSTDPTLLNRCTASGGPDLDINRDTLAEPELELMEGMKYTGLDF